MNILCKNCQRTSVHVHCHCNRIKRAETSKTLFYLRTVTYRDAPIHIQYHYWTIVPLSCVIQGMWRKVANISMNFRPPVTSLTDIAVFLSNKVKEEALKCEVTAVDKLGPQFLGHESSSHVWKRGIGTSLVPQIHYNLLRSSPLCRTIWKEWLSTLEWINAVWAYIKN